MPAKFVSQYSGSSPRGRGTRATIRLLPFDARFIPARAGNTPPPPPDRAPTAVHPRAGGEHTTRSASFLIHSGSSPRGRGTRVPRATEAATTRFIPARAGNTCSQTGVRKRYSVHPRAGGEHGSRTSTSICRAGSSPRGRGTPFDRARGDRRRRFIPARAGNTSSSARPPARPAVHPRAGGEHAPAGPFASAPGERFAVHPRAGGEHTGMSTLIYARYGSSPRGRGTRRLVLAEVDRARFIPARAGNTCSESSQPDKSSVHPRAGGEHELSQIGHDTAGGSSPRGRGTPDLRAEASY